ncbi:MAG: Xaa-Pro peptidase family protein [Bacteroidales bacterium]|nr:Xaa-Pro peptidase family protein [Bacteroidales bacterium]
MDNLVLLPRKELNLRLSRLRSLMAASQQEALLITDNANIYYLSGRVFSGYIYLPLEGMPLFFVRRPVELQGDGVVYIRKPEEMVATIGLNTPATIGLELDTAPYSAIERLRALFPQSKVANASATLRQARAVKTDFEIDLIRQSGIKQERVYRRIPHLYQPGMTDLELQVEIERVSRLEGCLGQFRICGQSMELYMGNVLVGKNADNPTPYDFAMGGEGLHPSLPVGCNGALIRPGDAVMVDMNGDYTGYMTDMTRTFALGQLDELALRAQQLSIDICRELSKALPSTPAKDLYEKAEEMVKAADLHPYFMGHRQKAGFIGHGVGIEVNELPVISPRSRDVLQVNNVIALEPKFVIPHVGAVGIENTYQVTPSGLKSLTNAPTEIITFVQ